MTEFYVTKEQLQELIDKNYSSYDIAKYFNKSQTSIRFWLKKYNLKTNFKFRSGGWTWKWTQERKYKQNNNFSKLNWSEIQKFYDSGKTWDDVGRKFNISSHILSKASKNNLFKSRKSRETWILRNPNRQGKKHTQETKNKLSTIRKEYLANTPNAFAWKNKDKFKSIPCEKVKNELKELKINFEEEHQPLLHNKRFFRIDISFIDKKIGFDINGRQHYDENRNLKPYYQNRHNLITNDGWILYEIPYHVAMRKDFVKDYILPILNGIQPSYDISLYTKKVPAG